MALGAAVVGVGLRSAHYAVFTDGAPAASWLEVHAENYFGLGGIEHRLLRSIAERYPISVHGVALSLGSPEGLDPEHLSRLAALVADVDAILVSEHLAWSRHGGTYYNDLLPVPLTEEALAVVADNVARAQDLLRRPVLIENPSAYLTFDHATVPEPEFLAALVARTGCGLLLDINNLYVSANNLSFDASTYLARLPAEAVGEIHLAGHEASSGAALLIDTHARPVAQPVWDLFAEAIGTLGPRPTLIEWDTDLPALDVLLGEARLAALLIDGVRDACRSHAT